MNENYEDLRRGTSITYRAAEGKQVFSLKDYLSFENRAVVKETDHKDDENFFVKEVSFSESITKKDV